MANNAAILRQVEYYFSDDSFPYDEFLQKLASEEGKNGFIDVSVLAEFGKMKSLLADASDKVAAVAAALEASDSVQLNEDKTGVKRLYPIPSEDPAADRIVFGAQFLSDEARAGLKDTFSKFGAVQSVRCLRNLASDDRPFNGGVLITFEDASSVAAAKLAASKAEIIGTGGPALLQSLADFYEDFQKKCLGMRKKRGSGGGGGGAEEGGGKKRRVEAPPAVFDENYPKGIIVEVSGLGSGMDREIIKEKCLKFGPVGWVEYERDDASAQVRFNEPEHAKAMCDADNLGFETFSDAKASLVDGDVERAYWVKKHEDTVKRMSSRGGKGKGRKGKGGKGSRRR